MGPTDSDTCQHGVTGPDTSQHRTTDPDTGQHGPTVVDWAQGLLGLVMVASGVGKLLGTESHVESFERWGYPQWFRVATGGTEVFGGASLLVGVGLRGRLRSRTATVVGGSLVGGTMIGAVYTHLRCADDPPSEAAKPGILLAVAALVTRRNRRRGADEERQKRPDCIGDTGDGR